MKYLEERSQLVSVIEDLIRWGVLDCAGGAVGLRLSSGDLLMSTTARTASIRTPCFPARIHDP